MCGICFSMRLLEPFSSPSSVDHTPEFAGDEGLDVPFVSSLNLNATVDSNSSTLGTDRLDSGRIWELIKLAITPRGPDYSGSQTVIVDVAGGRKVELKFHATILHMRGQELTRQPFISKDGDVFLWNGEVFDGLSVEADENDGQVLFDLLQQNGHDRFLSTLRNIEGPYAFIYYQASTKLIYFGRDPVGRRSLLLHSATIQSDSIYLSSCGLGLDHPLIDWEEISSEAIYSWDLNLLTFERRRETPESYSRVFKSSDLTGSAPIYPFDQLITSIPIQSDLLPSTTVLPSINSATPSLVATSCRPVHTPLFISTMNSLLRELSASVAARVALSPYTSPAAPPVSLHAERKARIAILFSGGLDCTTLALLADDQLAEGEEIDLMNVGFENPRVLRSNDPVPRKKKTSKAMRKLKNVGEAAAVVDVIEEREEEDNCAVASSIYDVPDRLTGLASSRELQSLRPNRTWNFVQVNVTYTEMLEHRMKVLELMRPQKTIMDLSISIAFYFAARGIGFLYSPTSLAPIPYTSTARILLSGLGADELLGGYSRHRKTFHYATPPLSPWSALIEELQTDISRISSRNLGRDDRIISFHGKEARYPFLASNVIDLLTKTPIWLKCDHRFGEGVGDKILLREMANTLGLEGASGLKKRAIHFGSRTAKMELDSGKAKGEDDFVL